MAKRKQRLDLLFVEPTISNKQTLLIVSLEVDTGKSFLLVWVKHLNDNIDLINLWHQNSTIGTKHDHRPLTVPRNLKDQVILIAR